MLRLVTNKARHHYNVALEHAERGRITEAIDELHNALDLDRRFTNAHVVLGTLYAKRGEFDRARESWTEALALQPELAKAHQYLQRVEKVEKSLPALRRLRTTSVALLIACLGLLTGLILTVRERPAARLLQEAQTALSSRDYGRAIERLEEARRVTRPGSTADAAAASLHSALQSELRQEVARIQELKYREEYPKVLAALADLESRRPDAVTSAALVNIRQDVNHYYLGQLRRLYEGYESGQVAYGDFVQKAQEFFDAYPDIPEKQDIAAFLDRARELEASRRLAAIRMNYETTLDLEQTLAALREAREEFPDSPAAAEGRAEAVDLILSSMFDQFQELVDSEDFAAAAELLNRIEEVAGGFRDVVNVSGPIELAGRVLNELWIGARLKEAEQLVRGGDPNLAREALLLLAGEAQSLTTPARELVANLEEELDRRIDQQELAELRERRAELLEGNLEDSEATRTFALASRLARWLDDPKERAEVLAYAAAAAFQAGQREQASELAGRAREGGHLDSKLAADLQKLLKRKSDDLERRPTRPARPTRRSSGRR